MNDSHEETMQKISVVNLDKLLDNFSEIEKKISEINEANNLLVLQLEKCNRLLTLSQSKEESVKEDENDRLKSTIHILEERLKACEQKLQHLQEEKNKEIEILRNTIRDLEQRLNKGQDLHFKRRRF